MAARFELLVAARYLRASRREGVASPAAWRRKAWIYTAVGFLLPTVVGLLLVLLLWLFFWRRSPLATEKGRGEPRFVSLGTALFVGLVWLCWGLCAHQLKVHYSAALSAALPVLWALALAELFFLFWIVFFVELIRKLTIFSTLSIAGLFVGTEALVVVLSVMSGFEQDLKHKILGTHAHMTITTPDRSFTDYREALSRLDRIPGVVAGTPYLTSEVMLASASNLSGVIIKGIDPTTIGRVTDLVQNTDVGSLDNLLHPEKLRSLGLPPPPPPDEDVEPAGAGPPPKDAGQADPAAEAKAKAAKGTAGKADRPANKATDRPADKTGLGDARPSRPQRRLLPGLVIGRELAKNLRIYLGDDVNVVSPMGDIGPSGPIPKAKPFRVAAIFFSGMYEYDSKYMYMTLPAAQKFLGLLDEVTGLELKLVDPDHTDETRRRVEQALGSGPDGKGYLVEDWQTLNRSLFSALKLEKIAMFIVLCFIILVAAFSIISNGIMLVMEKGKEVAILKAMGGSDRMVLRIFLLLGLYMGLLGTGVGIVLGIFWCKLLERVGLPLNTDVYYITKLPVDLHFGEVAAVFAAALILTLSATAYPAWRAARLRPVEALR